MLCFERYPINLEKGNKGGCIKTSQQKVLCLLQVELGGIDTSGLGWVLYPLPCLRSFDQLFDTPCAIDALVVHGNFTMMHPFPPPGLERYELTSSVDHIFKEGWRVAKCLLDIVLQVTPF